MQSLLLKPAALPYGVALARRCAVTKPGTAEMHRINHRYSLMSPADKLRFHAEIWEIREAKRLTIEAQVIQREL